MRHWVWLLALALAGCYRGNLTLGERAKMGLWYGLGQGTNQPPEYYYQLGLAQEREKLEKVVGLPGQSIVTALGRPDDRFESEGDQILVYFIDQRFPVRIEGEQTIETQGGAYGPDGFTSFNAETRVPTQRTGTAGGIWQYTFRVGADGKIKTATVVER